MVQLPSCQVGLLPKSGKSNSCPSPVLGSEGTIAQHYEKLGGSFTFFGKPQVAHFEACLRKLKIDRERVAHVGDSLHHDVAGANNSGINCVFVTGGIHLNDLDADFGSLPSTESLHALFDKHQIRPTHVIPSFITHP